MSDALATVDWRELQEFAGVDLTASFILSWQVESETLIVDVDVLLLAEHPFYETPRPKEKVCIRPAVIEFAYCESLKIDGRRSETLAGSVDRLGHGAIAGLQVLADGCFELSGDFGTVVIESERPVLRLKGP